MNISCAFQQSIVVTDNCALLTSAQWQTAPGSCRLRVKNYNPADFAGACAGCIASGLPDWNGEWAQFCNLGGSELYSPSPTVSIGGKRLLTPICVANNFGVLAGQWVFQLVCDNGGVGLLVWASSAGPATAAGPTGVYTRSGLSCLAGPATLTIEGYSL